MDIVALIGKMVIPVAKKIQELNKDSKISDKIDVELYSLIKEYEQKGKYQYLENIMEDDLIADTVDEYMSVVDMDWEDFEKFTLSQYNYSPDRNEFLLEFLKTFCEKVLKILKDSSSIETKLILKGLQNNNNNTTELLEKIQRELESVQSGGGASQIDIFEIEQCLNEFFILGEFKLMRSLLNAIVKTKLYNHPSIQLYEIKYAFFCTGDKCEGLIEKFLRRQEPDVREKLFLFLIEYASEKLLTKYIQYLQGEYLDVANCLIKNDVWGKLATRIMQGEHIESECKPKVKITNKKLSNILPSALFMHYYNLGLVYESCLFYKNILNPTFVQELIYDLQSIEKTNEYNLDNIVYVLETVKLHECKIAEFNAEFQIYFYQMLLYGHSKNAKFNDVYDGINQNIIYSPKIVSEKMIHDIVYDKKVYPELLFDIFKKSKSNRLLFAYLYYCEKERLDITQLYPNDVGIIDESIVFFVAYVKILIDKGQLEIAYKITLRCEHEYRETLEYWCVRCKIDYLMYNVGFVETRQKVTDIFNQNPSLILISTYFDLAITIADKSMILHLVEVINLGAPFLEWMIDTLNCSKMFIAEDRVHLVEAIAEKIIQIDETSFKAYFYRGVKRYSENNYMEAVEDFQNSFHLNNEEISAKYLLNCNLQLGNFEINEVADFLRDSNQSVVQANLSLLYYKNNMEEDGRFHLIKALLLDANNNEIHQMIIAECPNEDKLIDRVGLDCFIELKNIENNSLKHICILENKYCVKNISKEIIDKCTVYFENSVEINKIILSVVGAKITLEENVYEIVSIRSFNTFLWSFAISKLIKSKKAKVLTVDEQNPTLQLKEILEEYSKPRENLIAKYYTSQNIFSIDFLSKYLGKKKLDTMLFFLFNRKEKYLNNSDIILGALDEFVLSYESIVLMAVIDLDIEKLLCGKTMWISKLIYQKIKSDINDYRKEAYDSKNIGMLSLTEDKVVYSEDLISNKRYCLNIINKMENILCVAKKRNDISSLHLDKDLKEAFGKIDVATEMDILGVAKEENVPTMVDNAFMCEIAKIGEIVTFGITGLLAALITDVKLYCEKISELAKLSIVHYLDVNVIFFFDKYLKSESREEDDAVILQHYIDLLQNQYEGDLNKYNQDLVVELYRDCGANKYDIDERLFICLEKVAVHFFKINHHDKVKEIMNNAINRWINHSSGLLEIHELDSKNPK